MVYFSAPLNTTTMFFAFCVLDCAKVHLGVFYALYCVCKQRAKFQIRIYSCQKTSSKWVFSPIFRIS